MASTLAAPLPPSPMLASVAPLPKDATGYCAELKWDGARGLARVHTGAELYSRNGHNLRSFPELCDALATALDGRSAILDGEIVAVDHHGRPSFQRLQRRLHRTRPPARLCTAIPATFLVFDVLFLDGVDVTRLSYLQRRALLENLELDHPRLAIPPSWIDVASETMLSVAAEFSLEGFILKRSNSTYQPGRRSPDWIKYVRRERARVLLCGWIPSRSNPDVVATLLLGAYDRAGALTYCGHVGSFGLTTRLRCALHEQLVELACPTSPFTDDLPDSVASTAQWVWPQLVGLVEYREFNGRFRHPVLKGFMDTDPATAKLPNKCGH